MRIRRRPISAIEVIHRDPLQTGGPAFRVLCEGWGLYSRTGRNADGLALAHPSPETRLVGDHKSEAAPSVAIFDGWESVSPTRPFP